MAWRRHSPLTVLLLGALLRGLVPLAFTPEPSKSSQPCPSRREASMMTGLGAALLSGPALAESSADLIVGASREKAKYEAREGGFFGANKFKKQTAEYNYTDLQSFLPKLFMAKRSFEIQLQQLNDKKELEQRREKRKEAEANRQAAVEAGDAEQILKSTKATVKVTKEQNEETKKLLRLMGVPVVDAPSEAEATCAALCRDGKVFAAATEDADCLTFGTKILIRNLMAAESQKKTILEVNLELALQQLNISMDQFIDFCILCGCDYCDTLKGVGPSTAIKLLVQHGTLEKAARAQSSKLCYEDSKIKLYNAFSTL
ncbi:Flap endonuclease 1-A (FEN-1-A) (Flap structure-specific endonuclease 1-A) [Durusdinium trenchii]|uniref:Flap endonuclease 1-A (FEN-1-A) (Flap structure-specific endonuclease 1-A) n=2 Tax=Durusdinium trenchii TaxID=1381693 RepID=A0ABP0JQV8_9DINO